jgi:hypothetical protein
LGGLDNAVHALSSQVFHELLQVPAGLLHLFIFVANVTLFDSFVESILSLVRILLDDVDKGVDGLVVRLVLLGVQNNLLESGDELVLCLISSGKLFIQIL